MNVPRLILGHGVRHLQRLVRLSQRRELSALFNFIPWCQPLLVINHLSLLTLVWTKCPSTQIALALLPCDSCSETSTKLLKGDLSSCLNNIYSTNLSALLTKCCSDAGPLQFFAIYGEIAEITIFAGYPSTSFNPWICNFSNFSQFFAAACIHGHISSCMRNEPYCVNSHASSYEISSSSVSLNLM